MNIKSSSPLFAVFILSSCWAGAATNLLLNPSFELNVGSPGGNNIGIPVPNWTLVVGSGTISNNLVRPDNTYTDGPNVAQHGAQYYDIVGNSGYIYQNFTLASAGAVDFGAYFSARSTGAGQGSVSIWDLTLNTLVFNSATVNPPTTPAYPWVQVSAAVSLMAGNYQFRANMSDSTNVDSAFVSSVVPEPTSALAGILLGVGLLRRRRSLRVQA